MINRQILMVEDSPDDELLMKRAFKAANLMNEIIVVHDGQEALDMLLGEQGLQGLPAVVLLDLKLPKVGGMEVLRRLRADERTRRLPVVILTSSDEELDLVNGYSNGANSYVRKPVNFQAFAEAVRSIGLYWAVINEPPPGHR